MNKQQILKLIDPKSSFRGYWADRKAVDENIQFGSLGSVYNENGYLVFAPDEAGEWEFTIADADQLHIPAIGHYQW